MLVAILEKVYAVEHPSLHSGKRLLTKETLNKSVVTGKLTLSYDGTLLNGIFMVVFLTFFWETQSKVNLGVQYSYSSPTGFIRGNGSKRGRSKCDANRLILPCGLFTDRCKEFIEFIGQFCTVTLVRQSETNTWISAATDSLSYGCFVFFIRVI